MNTAAIKRLRQKLKSGEATAGVWVSLEAPSISEMAVALGLDWIIIDAEHGHLDFGDIVAHLRCVVRSDTVALVRIAELNSGLIKRVLDCGADGVVVPWIESAEQLRAAVQFASYPPQGTRGIGAERATAWGQAFVEHAATANEHVLVVPIIETIRAKQNLHELLSVAGVDLFYFGPADYSASAGYRGQWEGPGVAEDLLAMNDTLRRAGKHTGVMTRDAHDLRRRAEQGFQLLGLGLDSGLLIRALRQSLAALDRRPTMRADLSLSVSPGSSSGTGVAPHAKTEPFRLALTADFYESNGQLSYRDVGLDVLERDPRLAVERFDTHCGEVEPAQLKGPHGVMVLTPRVTAQSLAQSDTLLALGRFGVGFDSVDVQACTEHDVLLFIAAGAVDHSVAEATVLWMLALSHHVRVKDAIVRETRWHDRRHFMGSELRERTLGLIGCGGIGRAVLRQLSGFDMRPPLVFDPHLSSASIAELGARSVTLDELLAQSDFVSLHCPLNESTRNLIGARELALMRPTAYLINTARGGIVDEQALDHALRQQTIAGAAMDCFVGEPLTAPPSYADLDNVLLAPHAIAWTDELFRDIGRTVCQGFVDLLAGRVPRGVVNPAVLERPGFQAKWQRWRR